MRLILAREFDLERLERRLRAHPSRPGTDSRFDHDPGRVNAILRRVKARLENHYRRARNRPGGHPDSASHTIWGA